MRLSRPFAVALTTFLVSTTAPAAPAGETSIVVERCKERLAIVLGAEDEVRDRVPETYELVRHPASRRPLVWVSSIHCEGLTVSGVSAPTTRGIVAALIESPDGSGCLSPMPTAGDSLPDPAFFCNFYLLWEATDNAGYAEFVRSGTPDFPISFSEELFFEEGQLDLSQLGVPFRFRSGPSAPFRLDSDFVVRQRPGAVPSVALALWAETGGGTVKINVFVENLEFGEANGTVRTEAGSELAEVFGGEVGKQAPGFALIGAPRWSRAVLTKTMVG